MMITPILRSVRAMFRPTTSIMRAFSAMPMRRPMAGLEVARKAEGIVVKSVGEQIRGMKVRSSVKKMCEGCKVCWIFHFGLVFLELGCEWEG